MFAATRITAAVAAGLVAGLTAFAPIAAADTHDVADPQTSTAQAHPTTPIDGQSGAPVGDTTPGADPLIPFGTDPLSKVKLGYIDRNHDEGNTANGFVDVPF
jgi:hypothetical protein